MVQYNLISFYPVKHRIEGMNDVKIRNEFLNNHYCVTFNLGTSDAVLQKQFDAFRCKVDKYDTYNYYAYIHRYGYVDYLTYEQVKELFLMKKGSY
ncbi:MAG: hypothetical protein IKT40_14400 [Bacilli bacterium]|nr:hypothetical protein [Bacilli bacterium]